MSLPFAPRSVMTNAQRRGLRPLEAGRLAAVAFHQLQTLQTLAPRGQIVTAADVAIALKQRADAEAERADRDEADLRALGIVIPEWPMIPEGYFTRDSQDGSLDDEAMGYDEPLKAGFDIEKDHLSGGPQKKFKFERDGIDVFFGGNTPYNPEEHMSRLSLKHTSHDLITALCQHAELAVELGKHLGPRDILNLYTVSRSFHEAVRNHMYSTVKTWLKFNAPVATRVFDFRLYRRHLVPDPSGRTWVGQDPSAQSQVPAHRRHDARLIPGMKYLQMVLGRVRCCREIIAIMARNGHRLPNGMLATLVRLWLLMEVATTAQRQAMLRSPEMWSERDLYNAQFFFVKLSMHFIDPVFGPAETELVNIMLGQKGLYPLWQLLMCKKYTKFHEFVELKLRYDFEVPDELWDRLEAPLYGVPYVELGLVHLEGWGAGSRHLLRPNELIPIEAVARGLELDEHLMDMVIWGYIDFTTGENLIPTEDEMYISDDENVLKHMDTRHHWKRKHALKKRWNDLTPQQQQEIIKDDEQERLRSLAFCGDYENDYTGSDEVSSDDESDGWSSSTYSLDDEIRRGMPLRPQPECNPSEAPALDDAQAWANFVNDTLLGMGADVGVGEDQVLLAQEWETYDDTEMFTTFDWCNWLDDTTGGLDPGEDYDDGYDEDGDYDDGGGGGGDGDDDDDDDDGEEDDGMDDIHEDDGNGNDGNDNNGHDNSNDGSNGNNHDDNNDNNSPYGDAHAEETDDEMQDESTEEETEEDETRGDGVGEVTAEGEESVDEAFETRKVQQGFPEQDPSTKPQWGQHPEARIDPRAYAVQQVHLMMEEDSPPQRGQLLGMGYQGPATNQGQPGQEQSSQPGDALEYQTPGQGNPTLVTVPVQQPSQHLAPTGYQIPAHTQQPAQQQRHIPMQQQQQQAALQHQVPAQNQAHIQLGGAQPQAAQHQALQQQQWTAEQRQLAQEYREFQQFRQRRAQQTQQIQQFWALQPQRRQQWLAQRLQQRILAEQAQRQQQLEADQLQETQELESRHAQEDLYFEQMLLQTPALQGTLHYANRQGQVNGAHFWERHVLEQRQAAAQRRVLEMLPAGMRSRPQSHFYPHNANMRLQQRDYEGSHPLEPRDGPVHHQGGFAEPNFGQMSLAQVLQHVQPQALAQIQQPVQHQQPVQPQVPTQNQQFLQHSIQNQAQQPAHHQDPIQTQQFAQLQQPAQHQLAVQSQAQHQGQVQHQGVNLLGSQNQAQPQGPAQG